MADKDTLEQAENILESTRGLNNLMLENVAKLVTMNIELVENFSQIGFENYKAALGVKSLDELRDYAQKQRETAQDIAERISQDSNKILEMTNEYVAGAQKVAGSTLTSLSANPFFGLFGILDKRMDSFWSPQRVAENAGRKTGEPPEDIQ